MTEENNQTPPPPPASEPPPPPASAPPPPPPPPAAEATTAAGGGDNTNKTLMLVLAYLWILALIPLLVEKEDKEIQWHSKNGLLLLAAEFVLWIVLTVLGFVPVLGCVTLIIMPLAFLGVLVLRVIAIIKATQGQRLVIPGLSQYADQF